MTSRMSAIELLKLGDADRKLPVLNQYWPYVTGIPFGLGLGAFFNFVTRRPVFSGIQKHIICAAICTVSFNYANNKRYEYYAEKDAVLRHYVELHPDDFVEPAKKKIGDVLEPWIPIR